MRWTTAHAVWCQLSKSRDLGVLQEELLPSVPYQVHEPVPFQVPPIGVGQGNAVHGQSYGPVGQSATGAEGATPAQPANTSLAFANISSSPLTLPALQSGNPALLVPANLHFLERFNIQFLGSSEVPNPKGRPLSPRPIPKRGSCCFGSLR